MLKAMRLTQPTGDKEMAVLEYTPFEASNLKAMISLLKEEGKDNEQYVVVKEHGRLLVKETTTRQVSLL